MPQSLANVLVHLVFSTKHRQPYLRTAHLRDTLTAYTVGVLRNLDCPSLIVGGPKITSTSSAICTGPSQIAQSSRR